MKGTAAEGNAAGGTDEVRRELEYWRRPRDIGAALEAFRWCWGEAYEIGYDFDGGEWWFRRRIGLGGIEAAPDPDELRRLIIAEAGP
jgi:hypothetical protein